MLPRLGLKGTDVPRSTYLAPKAHPRTPVVLLRTQLIHLEASAGIKAPPVVKTRARAVMAVIRCMRSVLMWGSFWSINQPTPFFGAWRSTSGRSLFGMTPHLLKHHCSAGCSRSSPRMSYVWRGSNADRWNITDTLGGRWNLYDYRNGRGVKLTNLDNGNTIRCLGTNQ